MQRVGCRGNGISKHLNLPVGSLEPILLHHEMDGCRSKGCSKHLDLPVGSLELVLLHHEVDAEADEGAVHGRAREPADDRDQVLLCSEGTS